ncbi:MAG TPA: hypothetical protein VMY34_09095 [Acidimicrobiales bacterium]|nr:hypothetical protein [Acidimicrobiales bacterium]
MQLRRIVATTGLAVVLAGFGSYEARADHCTPMLMFSGVTAGPAAGPKVNPGATSCTTDDENVNPNYFTPGANSMSVGITADPAAGLNADGTRKVGAALLLGLRGVVELAAARLGGRPDRVGPLWVAEVGDVVDVRRVDGIGVVGGGGEGRRGGNGDGHEGEHRRTAGKGEGGTTHQESSPRAR